MKQERGQVWSRASPRCSDGAGAWGQLEGGVEVLSRAWVGVCLRGRVGVGRTGWVRGFLPELKPLPQ